jgi:leucyl aminopeptidase
MLRKNKPEEKVGIVACQIYLVEESQVPALEDAQILGTLKFKGGYGSVAFLPEKSRLYVGLSLRPVKTVDPFYKPDFYSLGATVARALEKTGYQQLQIMTPQTSMVFGTKELVDLILGIRQAAWKFDKYLSNTPTFGLQYEIMLDSYLQQLFHKPAQQKVDALHQAMTLTRYLVEEQPNEVHPEAMQDIVKAELKGLKNVKLELISQSKMEQLGMEGILAVNRASRFEAVLVHATLVPNGKVQRKVVLIGKGLTYDSGGLDIKTEGHMKTMKMDMAGSATMFGTLRALADIDLEHTEVHWFTAYAENMVGGDAFKADDILVSYSGQTIEVMNTDAEGRLTLADVLAYATFEDPDYIVDAATLTGASMIANSEYYTALMGNDQTLIDGLMQAFTANSERTVHNPLPEELRQYVKGDISDLNNTSTLSRQAGHETAGLFLSHFVDQTLFRNPKLKIKESKCYPWVHLDIAGPAYNKGHNQLKTNGATAQCVRSLVDWILTLDGK